MKRKFIVAKLLLVFLVSSVLPMRVNAGIPTIDVASIVQETITAIEQIEQVVQMYNQIDNQIRQIENQVEAFENMNGDYFKDLLLNSFDDKEARRWLPEDYQDVLALYDRYSSGGWGAVRNSGWNAVEDFSVPGNAAVFTNEELDDWHNTDRKRWEARQKSGMAAVGVADNSFSRVTEIIEESEQLIADIPNSTDAKAAADLNNRIAAQNQIVLAELLRIQSAQTATQGRDQLYQHAVQTEDKKQAQVRYIRDIRNY
ncbi:type IV secretion system protein [Gilvimarinus chinensis]|uniref:type IV secretion system protein n=1 Tax=Gilvimarinus chinensis TaxID=396005 RepID=UPI00037EDB1E|nr:type IV secretion system protein [Gilvimarinus chinensis]